MEGRLLLSVLLMSFFVGVPASIKWGKVPSCQTVLRANQIHFEWVIQNYTLRPEDRGEAINSPSFYDKRQETRWNVILYPRGRKDSQSDYVGIFVCLKYSEVRLERATFNVSLYSTLGSSVQNVMKNMLRLFPFASSDCWGWPNFIDRVRLEREYLTNGALGVQIVVERIEERNICPGSVPEHTHKDERYQECETTAKMLEEELVINREFADYGLQMSGHEFPVHRAIVWARSPSFYESMIAQQIDEVLNGSISIRAIQQFLVFMYSGTIPPLSKLDPDLLTLATQYRMNNHVVTMEDLLVEDLQDDTAAILLSMTNRFVLPRLQLAVWTYLDNRAEEVLASRSWKQLLNEEPQLASLVFQRLMGRPKGGNSIRG